MFTVEYIINSSKIRVTKTFKSIVSCRNLVNKLRHSKKCTLISYPNAIYE